MSLMNVVVEDSRPDQALPKPLDPRAAFKPSCPVLGLGLGRFREGKRQRLIPLNPGSGRPVKSHSLGV